MPEIEAIPQRISHAARQAGAAIIVADYYMSRRQRVHFGWLPENGEWFAEREFADVAAWCLEQGRDTVFLVPGVRRSPRHFYRLTLAEYIPRS